MRRFLREGGGMGQTWKLQFTPLKLLLNILFAEVLGDALFARVISIKELSLPGP